MVQGDKIIFMHNNAPSYSAKETTEYLNKISFKGFHLMKWLVCLPDFKLTEKFWTILKRKIYMVDSKLLAKMNFEMLFHMKKYSHS